MQKLPIVFFGSSAYVVPIIESLNKNFDLKLVITTEQRSTDPVPAYCKRTRIPCMSVVQLSDLTIHHKLSTINAPLISQDIIDLFPKGIVNIHPSMLPEYRGTTPIQRAILDGKTSTGVSIMLLDEEVDHGPLLAQIPLAIAPTDTAESLYKKAFTLGAEKLVEILPRYASGTLKPQEQDHTKATYTQPLTRNSGYIDIHSQSSIGDSQWLARAVRAYHPWPGVWFVARIKHPKGTSFPEAANQEVRIKLLPAGVIPGYDRGSIKIDSPFQGNDIALQVEGKKPMGYKDFINGYPEGKAILEKLHLT